jgi:hypothetical protein
LIGDSQLKLEFMEFVSAIIIALSDPGGDHPRTQTALFCRSPPGESLEFAARRFRILTEDFRLTKAKLSSAQQNALCRVSSALSTRRRNFES